MEHPTQMQLGKGTCTHTHRHTVIENDIKIQKNKIRIKCTILNFSHWTGEKKQPENDAHIIFTYKTLFIDENPTTAAICQAKSIVLNLLVACLHKTVRRYPSSIEQKSLANDSGHLRETECVHVVVLLRLYSQLVILRIVKQTNTHSKQSNLASVNLMMVKIQQNCRKQRIILRCTILCIHRNV